MAPLIPDDEVPICGTLMLQSRVSRELVADIWAVNFKDKVHKPVELQRLRLPGLAVGGNLFLISGRESGVCYYSTAPLTHSASAAALLSASGSLNQAYARMPLLMTPSQFVSWDAFGFEVAVEPDLLSPTGVALTDGMAEVGLELAKRLNLWVTDLTEDDLLDRCLSRSPYASIDHSSKCCRECYTVIICYGTP